MTNQPTNRVDRYELVGLGARERRLRRHSHAAGDARLGAVAAQPANPFAERWQVPSYGDIRDLEQIRARYDGEISYPIKVLDPGRSTLDNSMFVPYPPF